MSLRALWPRVASAPENDLASPPDRLRELQEPVLERQAGLCAAGPAEGAALSDLGEPVGEQEEKALSKQAKQYPAWWSCDCGKAGRSRTQGAAVRAAQGHRPTRGFKGRCRIAAEAPRD
jgi:hypothetical protein